MIILPQNNTRLPDKWYIQIQSVSIKYSCRDYVLLYHPIPVSERQCAGAWR
jgi:hypothetical protein